MGTSVTFADFTIASAASVPAVLPRVSTKPRAVPRISSVATITLPFRRRRRFGCEMSQCKAQPCARRHGDGEGTEARAVQILDEREGSAVPAINAQSRSRFGASDAAHQLFELTPQGVA